MFNRMQMEESSRTFADHMLNSTMIRDRDRLHDWVLTQALSLRGNDGLFVEFGVQRAHSVNRFAKMLQKIDKIIYGFDAFEGIEEDWDADRLAGKYSLNGIAPNVEKNVTLVKGWVQDTLPLFLAEHASDAFAFIHLDMDTYTPTRLALDLLRPRLRKDTIILFDELHGYPNWKVHEYKALQETLTTNQYEFIAFGLQQAAIRITQDLS